MSRLIKTLVFGAILALPFNAFCQELPNLTMVKQQLVQYHDSGQYMNDLITADNDALQYLEKRVKANNNHKQKLALVLDIDETSLSNYANMREYDFGGTKGEIFANMEKGEDQAIASTLQLYQYAKAHEVAVFFITGRPDNLRSVTSNNLKKAGYDHWDGLYLRPDRYTEASITPFKTEMRKKITQQGYDIALNVGDQNSDLKGGYADKTVQLPNPYYYLP
jgi:predicted secreted acid phosphatase